eukprot:gene21769-27829_t
MTGSPAYVGATLFLPQNHALRHLAARPMPEGYFGENAEINVILGEELATVAGGIPVAGDNIADAARALEEDNEADLRPEVVHRDVPSLRGPHPYNLPSDLSWVSENFPYNMFSMAIDSPVTDPRPQETMGAVSQAEYIDNSKEAALMELQDFFRAGTRGCDTKTRKQALAQKRMAFLKLRKLVPGWRAGKFSRQWADSVHRCLNIPSAYTLDYQFDLPLKYSGNMNSHQTMMFMLAFCERFMGQVAKSVTNGGQKYILSVQERIVAKETAHENNLASYEKSKESFTDNSGMFSNMSPFVRLYFTFEAAHLKWKNQKTTREKRDFPSFVGWIEELYAIYNDDREDAGDFSPDKVSHLVSNVIYDREFTTREVICYLEDNELEKLCSDLTAEFVDAAVVFIKDFSTIIRELAEFGVKLTGRGCKYAEDTFVFTETVRYGQQRERAFTVKADNVLKDNWHLHFQTNSCDPILHGCPFANITLRRATQDAKRGGHHYVDMNDSQTYVGDKQFISLNYVDSTAVALSALDQHSLPVMNPSQVRRNMKFAPKDYKLMFSKVRSDELERLYFIELHKERLNIEYSTVEDDHQKTKTSFAEEFSGDAGETESL